jgi:hypothetical protein
MELGEQGLDLYWCGFLNGVVSHGSSSGLVFDIGLMGIVVVLVKLKDDAFDRCRVALALKLLSLKIVVKLEPSLLPTDLFSECENVPEVKVAARDSALDRSEPDLVCRFGLGLLFSDFSFTVAA